jgi:hypothetical protein
MRSNAAMIAATVEVIKPRQPLISSSSRRRVQASRPIARSVSVNPMTKSQRPSRETVTLIARYEAGR